MEFDKITHEPINTRIKEQGMTKKYRRKHTVVDAYITTKKVTIHARARVGDMVALIGDYIITCANGEQYPCRADIFHETYEEVKCPHGCESCDGVSFGDYCSDCLIRTPQESDMPKNNDLI